MSADPGSTTAPSPATRAAGRWIPVLAVVAVVVAVVGGARLVGAPSSAVGPIDVGGGAVRLTPLPGWAAAEPPRATEAVLTRGGVRLDVSAIPGFRGTAVDLATRYAQEVLGSRLEDLTVGEPATGALASGIPTLRFGYGGVADGVAIEGVATSAVGIEGGVVFDASAPKGDLAWAVSDLGSMIRNAEVG